MDIRESIRQIWPDWELQEELGRGAYGVVYRAVRRDIVGTVSSAIKVTRIAMNSGETDALRREGLSLGQTRSYLEGVVRDLGAEIRLMESVRGYTNIVSIEDYKVVEHADEIAWSIFIRMELLTPLQKAYAGVRMTEQEVVRLGMDICSALTVCRKQNIVHRDIKPENIFVNASGDFKLGDFGVARGLDRLSLGLSRKGTYNYMAPEVFNNELMDMDIGSAARVDIYSLGLVLYQELNQGRLPFVPFTQTPSLDDRTRAMLRRMKGDALPAPVSASPSLANIVLKACAHRPEDRYNTAEEMRAALAATLEHSAQSRATIRVAQPRTQVTPINGSQTPAAPDHSTPVKRSNRWVPFAIGGAACVVAALAAFHFFTNRDAGVVPVATLPPATVRPAIDTVEAAETGKPTAVPTPAATAAQSGAVSQAPEETAPAPTQNPTEIEPQLTLSIDSAEESNGIWLCEDGRIRFEWAADPAPLRYQVRFLNRLGETLPIEVDASQNRRHVQSANFNPGEVYTFSVDALYANARAHAHEELRFCVPAPTAAPTSTPSPTPTAASTPTSAPTSTPTLAPTTAPTAAPTPTPTIAPTPNPTAVPTTVPTFSPTPMPATTVAIMSTMQTPQGYQGASYSDGTFVLRMYSGTESVLELPETIGSYALTSIGDFVFQGNNQLVSVALPDTVRSIGQSAFARCHMLRSVSLPASLQEIPDGCFFDCGNLISAVLPEGIDRIGIRAFGGCHSLALLSIGAGARYVEDGAFMECAKLTCIVLPQTIEAIAEDAFIGCPDGLTALVYPNSYAEQRCKELGVRCLRLINLEKGMTGEEVEYLQKRLNSLGHLNLSGVSLGVFDERTEQAVLSFQHSKGLQASGKANVETQLKLYHPLADQ